MGLIRDRDRTRQRILDAAAREFAARGYDATTMSAVARRGKVSKQLLQHHFRNKEALVLAVHDTRVRPRLEAREVLPTDPADLLAERFERHAGDGDYIRFLTWEAAAARGSAVPGQQSRRRRIRAYGTAIRGLQGGGGLTKDLDAKYLQLAVLALATYPMAFGQITRLVTGRAPQDPAFQREWARFLRVLGRRLAAPAAKRPRSAR